MTTITADDLRTELAHFTGTERWFSHWTRSCVYTEGVKHFAEQAGAYWFLDIIATEFIPLLRREEFLSILLAVNKGKASVVVSDGNGNALKTKKISFTDCPEGAWKFFFIADERPVILLPSEY